MARLEQGQIKRHKAREASFPIVGIGTSPRGFGAFAELLRHRPDETGLGFVLVQHPDPPLSSAFKIVSSPEAGTKVSVTILPEGEPS